MDGGGPEERPHVATDGDQGGHGPVQMRLHPTGTSVMGHEKTRIECEAVSHISEKDSCHGIRVCQKRHPGNDRPGSSAVVRALQTGRLERQPVTVQDIYEKDLTELLRDRGGNGRRRLR